MILPRLIIADEHRPGKIMSGVLIAGALKNMGYKLRLFMGNLDELSLRVLQLNCAQPVTLLDPALCDKRENLRWLFQQAASPDCLNLVITNLGGKWSQDSSFKITKECLLLAEWLECDIVPVLYGDASSTLTARTLKEILTAFNNDDNQFIRSVIFRSVLNDREYELIDRETGRQFTLMSMGSIPKSMERDAPPIANLFFEEAKQAIFPIKSASIQLWKMEHNINWAIFGAIASLSPNWAPQARKYEPITDAGKVNIAVVRHETLTLGGDGTEHLLRALGCNVVEVPLEGNILHNVPIHGVYIPHGLTYMTIPKFFGNVYLRTMLTRASNGSAFVFAEGGSAPILGHKINLPPKHSSEEEGRGFGILPYNSSFKSAAAGIPKKYVAIRKKLNPLLSGSQEWAWGYSYPSLALESMLPDEECWETKESHVSKKIGIDGWCKGRILASSMRIESWSAPASFRRWLEG